MTAHRYLRLSEVVGEFQVDEMLIRTLENEELIHLKLSSEGEPLLSAADVERVLVARRLLGELELNLPGVEVVMHMRDEMAAMRRQFAEILESVAAEMEQRLRR